MTDSAIDSAALVSAPACTDQPSAGHCPSSPPPPSVAIPETAPACTSSILSPAAATRTSSRSAANSEHPFFRWLLRAPASDAAAQHFRHHYLQSSPMCICTLFPVYSSKVDLQPPSNPSARRFLGSLSHYCLHCIQQVIIVPQFAVLEQYWTRQMQREWKAYYSTKVDRDRYALRRSVTLETCNRQVNDINRSLIPLMGQHGWQLREDGRSWSRRLSPEEAG